MWVCLVKLADFYKLVPSNFTASTLLGLLCITISAFGPRIVDFFLAIFIGKSTWNSLPPLKTVFGMLFNDYRLSRCMLKVFRLLSFL